MSSSFPVTNLVPRRTPGVQNPWLRDHNSFGVSPSLPSDGVLFLVIKTAAPRARFRERSRWTHFPIWGRGPASLQPGEPRRFLEEQPSERARREPQQGRALQPQRQPGLSRCELDTAGSSQAWRLGPVGAASWSGPLCPGIDQTSVLRSGSTLRPGTEPSRPGGGASRVAAGLFSGNGDVNPR
jgi:hypothetical protein